MESSINSSNDTNSTQLLDESYIYADVPWVATYLNLFILLIAIPATIIPSAVIIHIIRKTEELHTNYCLFLVNLLIGDILNAIRYCFGIVIMALHLLDIRVHISVDIAYIVITAPWVAIQYSFVLLAIDRVVGVAFPYHYRNIMKPRVVYALIASVWIIATVLLLLSRLILGPPYLVWQYGVFIPPSGVLGVVILYMLPQVASAIMIIGTNVYLYCAIIQSKKKLEDNLKLSGKDEQKVTRLQRLIQMQLQSSLPVFVLGGVDCLLNILRNVIYGVIVSFYPLSTHPISLLCYVHFVIYPMKYCQIIFHSVTYGIYQKTVRKKLRKHYQRFQRMLPPCPSKVVILNPQ